MILVVSYILYTSKLNTLLTLVSFAVLANNIVRLVKEGVLINGNYKIIPIESQPKKMFWEILGAMVFLIFVILRENEMVWRLLFTIILADGVIVQWRRKVILVNDFTIK